MRLIRFNKVAGEFEEALEQLTTTARLASPRFSEM